MPAIGIPSGSLGTPRVRPNTPLDGLTCGRSEAGTPNSRQSDSSHRPRPMSNSNVREAFVGSVACAAPPVSFQRSQLSTVPKASRPRRAAVFAPWRSIHSSFVALK